MSEPRTITLTLRARVLAAIVLLVLVVLLGGQLAFIVLQRGIVDDQRHIAVRQEDRSAPVLDTAKALLGSPDDAMAAAREAGDTLRQLRRVLRAALDEDLVGVTTGALRRAPQLLSAVDHAVAVLDRTYPTLRASLVTQRESLAIQRRTLALLERSLAVQRGTQAIAGETRDIARATLGHTESIDTKTGGQAPAGVVP